MNETEKLDLCSKYRPKFFKDMVGNDHVSSFLKSVINKPEQSPRYYGIFGPYGSSKCISKDSVITTDKNFQFLDEVWDYSMPTEFSDERTCSLNIFTQTDPAIADTITNNGVHPCFVLQPFIGCPIVGTYNQKVLVDNHYTKLSNLCVSQNYTIKIQLVPSLVTKVRALCNNLLATRPANYTDLPVDFSQKTLRQQLHIAVSLLSTLEHKNNSYHLTDPRVANFLTTILLYLGFLPSYNYDNRILSIFKPKWVADCFDTDQQKLLMKLCNFHAPVRSQFHLEHDTTSDYYYYETQFSVRIDKDQPTYDLVVPKHHNFLANNIIVHNTTTARAFGNELELKGPCEYIEIDSGDKTIKENFDKVRDLIFSENPGWKVICIDECHLLPPETSQRLLKILEDFSGRVFIFFCTTDPQLLPEALRSRLQEFFVQTLPQGQMEQFIQSISEKEGYQFSPTVYQSIAISSQGHYRSALKALEQAIFMGESKFLAEYNSIWTAIQDYFFNFDLDDDSVLRKLSSFHPVQLKPFVTDFFIRNIITTSAPTYNKLYPAVVVPKLFLQYIKFLSYVHDGDTYFAFLRVFRGTCRSIYERTRDVK